MNRTDLMTSINAVSSLLNSLLVTDMPKNNYDLVGQRYVVYDNSYAKEVNEKCEVISDSSPRLTGGVPLVIVRNPYIKEQSAVFGEKKYQIRMVMVQSLLSGMYYEVMFQESGLLGEDD